MKKSVIASVLGVCLIFAIGTMTFLLFKNNENKSVGSGTEKSAYGDYIKKGMESKTRTVNLLGEEKTVTYKYTLNTNDLSVEKRADSYGTTDVFEDKKNDDDYYYLYNSNVLCGYINWGIGEIVTDEMKKPIELSDEEITKQCDSYLKELYPNNKYKLERIFRDVSAQEYGAIYSYCLGEIKTDDMFSITFTKAGQLRGFSAYNFQRYEKFENSKLNLEKTEKSFQEKLKHVKAENISKRITLTDEGDLVIKYQYYDANEHYTKEIYEKILEQ